MMETTLSHPYSWLRIPDSALDLDCAISELDVPVDSFALVLSVNRKVNVLAAFPNDQDSDCRTGVKAGVAAFWTMNPFHTVVIVYVCCAVNQRLEFRAGCLEVEFDHGITPC